jgi:periplasmic nitrate reductase NapD
MADELHIASMVVQCAPRRLAEVTQQLTSMSGCIVHATSAVGKAVVTLEAACADQITAAVTRVQRLDGVLSAQLVYQCGDTLASMNEEIPDAETGVR